MTVETPSIYQGTIREITSTKYKVACGNGVTAPCVRDGRDYALGESVRITYNDDGVWKIIGRALNDN